MSRFGKRCINWVKSPFDKKNEATITETVDIEDSSFDTINQWFQDCKKEKEKVGEIIDPTIEKLFKNFKKNEQKEVDEKFIEKKKILIDLGKYYYNHNVEFITCGSKQEIGWSMIQIKNIKPLEYLENESSINFSIDKLERLYTYEEKKQFILYVDKLKRLFEKHNIDIFSQPKFINFEGKEKRCCICQGEFEKNEEVFCCELVKKNMSNTRMIDSSFDHYYHKCCYIDVIYSDLENNPSHNKCCFLCPNKICDTQQLRVTAN